MESRPLVVVGAGMSGTAAAIEAARSGVRVTLIDENPIPASMAALNVPQFFGQRFDAELQDRALMLERVVAANDALAEAEAAGVDIQLGTCVWGAFRNSDTSRVLDGPQLGLADRDRSWLIKYDRLIVAAGARDLGLAFAGWDQAGAVGARGAQRLLESYQALTSRRMVILGSGDLGLSTAQQALDSGIDIAAVVDVSASVRGDETSSLALREAGVRVYTSHAVKQAVGSEGEIESVVLVAIDDAGEPVAGSETVVAADTVCLAIGLVPNIELLSLLGCDLRFESELGGYVPVHDGWMQTSVEGVFVAGDVTGCNEDMTHSGEIARNQGRLAGIAAAESLGTIDRDAALARRRDLPAEVGSPTRSESQASWTRWLQALVSAGGPGLLACQCEQVTCAELIDLEPPRYLEWESDPEGARGLRTLATNASVNPDQVKRLTRAGMGHCQGRLCREQVALLLADESGTDITDMPLMSFRPPVRPLPLRVMWPHDESEQVRSEWPKWFSPTHRVLG